MENKKLNFKMREINGVIVRSVKETVDTWTHYIYVSEFDRNYKAGQFLSIKPNQFPELKSFSDYLEHVKGKREVIRAYSMTSAPMEKYVSITVKAELFDKNETKYPPLLSPFLASNLCGREIQFKGYTGGYNLSDDHSKHTDEVIHIVAGSGVVPSFSILKDELLNRKNINVNHTMIYVNKTYSDIIFNNELKSLEINFPERFKLINLLTRESDVSCYGSGFLKGRPTIDLIDSNIKDASKVLVFSCGAAITRWQKIRYKNLNIIPPMRFLDSIKKIINELGIDKKRFKYEDYG